MAFNATASTHVMHLDIRYKYLDEYVIDGIGRMVIVEFIDNVSGILKKIRQ